jgi:hypothetical protein
MPNKAAAWRPVSVGKQHCRQLLRLHTSQPAARLPEKQTKSPSRLAPDFRKYCLPDAYQTNFTEVSNLSKSWCRKRDSIADRRRMRNMPHGSYAAATRPHAATTEDSMPVPTDDEVAVHRDPERPRDLHDLPCHLDVGARRRRIGCAPDQRRSYRTDPK